MPWFEDLQIEMGKLIELGEHTFTQEEIISFAQAYDPQFFHIDPEAAKASQYGGLIASGWHTAAMWVRIRVLWDNNTPERIVDGKLPRQGASPGFLKLKWPNPVRPGDTIRFTTKVVEALELRSRPDWGIRRTINEGINQKGDLVLSFLGQGMLPRISPRREEV